MKTGIVYNKIFLEHDQAGHPENSKRLEAIVKELQSSGLWAMTEHLNSSAASIEELKLCHSEEYIKYVERYCMQGGGYLDPDTYANEFSFEATVSAVGSLNNLVEEVIDGKLKNGFALLRPPGHHALSNRSMGFCLFGNVAIAAKWALQKKEINKVAIVDIDVHHGNGTQALTEDDPNILYISTHQYPFYPGTGGLKEIGKGDSEGTILNIPFPPQVSDDGFKRIYDEIVLAKLKKFHPDLLLVSAGYDAHWDDPLANMGLSLAGYSWISNRLIDVAEEFCDSRIIFALEGGYNLKVLSVGVANTIRALLGLKNFEDPLGKSPDNEPDITSLMKELKQIHQL